MQPFGEMKSTASNIFSACASVAASMLMLKSMAEILPKPLEKFLKRLFNLLLDRFFTKLSTHMTIVVEEARGIARNEIYNAAEIYLPTKIDPDTDGLKVSKTSQQKNISFIMEKDHQVVDSYKGFELKWQFKVVREDNNDEKRYFELTFEKPNRYTVHNEYLPFVLAKAKEIKENERAIKLYTWNCSYRRDGEGRNRFWGGGINLSHPVTFDKLAMDPDLKQAIIKDLERFVGRKDYYRQVGKVWKRGYLLYGPPGTGKSSLIAAIANYLRFDVYDLELASLDQNSDLRKILLSTNNKSIIVIQDIDCSTQAHDRNNVSESSELSPITKLTLSGLLNFIDGLWSTCGDERIIIFTTNHKEKLDPALVRPGRMDMHIHMGYCTPEGFDLLASNYLGSQVDPFRLCEIKELIREVEITPAEIAEHLMRSENADSALKGVIGLLKQKKDEKGEMVKEIGVKEYKNDGD